MAKKTNAAEMPMDVETEQLLDDVEASWPTNKELAFVIDDPLEKLMEKAHAIFRGRHWDNLDALAVRIADVCPKGVTETNFSAAEPVAAACKKYFSNIEKLRTGLNRPFLDAKKAVDDAAKATVSRAEPTLNPIIKAVKAIQDRKKREEEEREAARLKKIEDDRLAAEKAHRDMIEAEQAAERKRLADEKAALEEQARAVRAEADKLAQERKDAEAKSKAANDELAELRKQLEQMGRTEVKGTPELAKAVVSAPIEKIETIQDYPLLPGYQKAEWKPSVPPLFDDEPTPLPPDPQESIQEDWEKARDDEQRDQACDPPAGDQILVREFGDQIAAFKDRVRRPPCVNPAAKQAVELAVFDLCEIAKRLQEWIPVV